MPNKLVGSDALHLYIENNIRLCPFHLKNGVYKSALWGSDYQNRDYWIRTHDELDGYLRRGFVNFKFIPKENGMLCLDIDLKHGNDGLAELKSYVSEAYLDYHLEHYTHVLTPNGGYHVYFRYDKDRAFNHDLGNGLEVKYGKLSLTCAGSIKQEGSYTLVNGLVINALSYFDDLSNLGRSVVKTPFMPYYKPNKIGGRNVIPLERIAESQSGKTHHNAQVAYAGSAKRCGYNVEDAIRVAQSRPDIFGIDSVAYTIRHCYNNFRSDK
jgi:hypothetical protein